MVKSGGEMQLVKYLDDLNPNFENKFDKKIFNNEELKFIENKIVDILIKYKYPIRSTILNRVPKYYFHLFNLEKIFYGIVLKKLKMKTHYQYFLLFSKIKTFQKKFLKKNLLMKYKFQKNIIGIKFIQS